MRNVIVDPVNMAEEQDKHVVNTNSRVNKIKYNQEGK